MNENLNDVCSSLLSAAPIIIIGWLLLYLSYVSIPTVDDFKGHDDEEQASKLP